MRLLTFFTGTVIVSLLLCMWMRSRQKEMAVFISMGEQKIIIFLQALLEAAAVFLIALIGSCGLGSLASGWLQDLLLSSVETSVFFAGFLTIYGYSFAIGDWQRSGCNCCIAVLIACNPGKSERYFITNGGIIR